MSKDHLGPKLCGSAHSLKSTVELPEKKNVELLEAVSNLMDSPGGMARHSDVRRLAGRVAGSEKP